MTAARGWRKGMEPVMTAARGLCVGGDCGRVKGFVRFFVFGGLHLHGSNGCTWFTVWYLGAEGLTPSLETASEVFFSAQSPFVNLCNSVFVPYNVGGMSTEFE
jgi:hypothetical protein